MSNKNQKGKLRAAAPEAAAPEDDSELSTETASGSTGDPVGALHVRVDGFQTTLTEHGGSIIGLRRDVDTANSKLDEILSRLSSISLLAATPTAASDSPTSTTSASTPSLTAHDSAAAAARGAPSARPRGGSISWTDPASQEDTARTDLPPSSNRHLVVKPEELGRFDGTPENTELFLSDITAIYESEPDPANMPAWEKAIVRALPRALRGSARLWFATLDKSTRGKMHSLQGFIDILRSTFEVQPAIIRQQARGRTWDPDNETILHYSFSKVALLKTSWPQLSDNDCVTDVVDGLPLEIRQLLRVPLLRSPKLTELRDELRVQELYWRERTGRPLLKSNGTDTSSSSLGAPGFDTLAQPAAAVFAQQLAPPSRAGGTFRRSRRGKSIREDFDPSRLSYAPHPESGKRTMSYRVPETNPEEIMWCLYPCQRCNGDHFGFAHEYCTSNSVHVAEVVEDDDYPVTLNF